MRVGNTIYLDHQATTPVDSRVSEVMCSYYTEDFGNPRSIDHVLGWAAAKAVESATEALAGLIGADPDEVIFTSGATEANNLALLGIGRRASGGSRRRILVSAIEHKCVLAAARALHQHSGYTVQEIPVDSEGRIEKSALENLLGDDVLLVSIMAVNNEIGTIEDIVGLSKPIRAAGCGRGDDIRYLRLQGIAADGWDPHYSPVTEFQPADVVNLGYVLNVIESPLERDAVLRKALQLAQRLLIVSVRVDQGPQSGETFNDGLITTRDGFQKLYTQSELRAYVESTLNHRPVMAGLGVAYIFKDETWQSRHFARTSVYRPTFGRQFAIDAFQSSELGAAFLNLARTLARLPRPREFSAFSVLCQQFGTPQRIARLATAILDPAYLENLRRRRRESFLVYYAATRLQGLRLPPFNLLIDETKADILSLWPSFKLAEEEGEAFLFSLGDSERVRKSTYESTVGKIVGDSLYAHRSIVDQLPSLSRLQIVGASQIVGEIEYDVVKLSADGRRVSFLRYPRFDTDAHLCLDHSLAIYLPKAEYNFRDYKNSDNPPILHRKDALVDETYPHYQKFHNLTKQEERKLLLSRPDIGHKQTWERILEESRLVVRGHRLLSS